MIKKNYIVDYSTKRESYIVLLPKPYVLRQLSLLKPFKKPYHSHPPIISQTSNEQSLMEFPHHHHHQRDDGGEKDRQSFGPPPPRNNFTDAPPPPGLYQSQPHFDPHAAPPPPAPYRSEPQFNPYAPPPPQAPYRSEPYFEAPSPPPPFGHVSHVGHHTSNEPYPPEHHRYGGYPPPNSTLESHGDHTGVTHVAHHSSHQSQTPGFHHRPDENRLPDNLAGLAGRSTVKVYSKAEPNYYLTIRDGKVILAPSDPSDEAQVCIYHLSPPSNNFKKKPLVLFICISIWTLI